jgi:hypothetical protein
VPRATNKKTKLRNWMARTYKKKKRSPCFNQDFKASSLNFFHVHAKLMFASDTDSEIKIKEHHSFGDKTRAIRAS